MTGPPDVRVVDNTEELRYELHLDGRVVAEIRYRLEPGARAFVDVDVEPQLQGHGLGSRLVEEALDDLRAQGLAVVPHALFVADFIKRYPEYSDLVAADPAVSDLRGRTGMTLVERAPYQREGAPTLPAAFVVRPRLGSRSERPESVPANRGEPTPADGIACGTDHEPVAAEQPRCLGACTNNACLRPHPSPVPIGKDGECNRRLRVARFGEGNKLCTGSHRCCFVAGYAPEAANRAGDNLAARPLAERHNTDGEPREKRCRRIRPKWSASAQETREPAQELQRHQSAHLPSGDLLDGRVDDIGGCGHPRRVNLTDVEPRQQIVEKRLRSAQLHCFLSHCLLAVPVLTDGRG
jgi:predicted GNAT family acetyltransferase